ncbi:hypothetical protein L6R50_18825 [Myxococcota bacterium]|nr:hypothetical protein [Myxococcota bacterium]
MMIRNAHAARWLLTAGALALAGCEPEVEDPAAHACEHVSEAGTAVTASDVMDANTPEIVLGEEPHTVTLAAATPGYVRVEIEGDTAALLFAGTADVVQGLFHGTEEESLPEPSPNDLCAEDIPEHYDLDFHEAGSYYLELLSAQGGDVWLLLSSAEGHGHE